MVLLWAKIGMHAFLEFIYAVVMVDIFADCLQAKIVAAKKAGVNDEIL
jgi:hypothetical protein